MTDKISKGEEEVGAVPTRKPPSRSGTEPVDAAAKSFKTLVAALQRAKGDPSERNWGSAVILIGAGCSVSAGIKVGKGIAQDCVKDLVQKYSNYQHTEDDPEAALTWLKQNGHIENEATMESVYPLLFRDHYMDPVAQQEIIRRAIETGKDKINWAHLCLGQMVKSGYIHTVLTTNFDQLALEGIVRTGIIPVVADGIESLARIRDRPQTPQLVHLHGSLHTYSPRNSPEDVQAVAGDVEAIRALTDLLRAATVFIVIGYAGGEEGVMTLLQKAAEGLGNKLIFWIHHGIDKDQLSVKTKLFLNTSKNSHIISGQDADVFFHSLLQALAVGVPEWMQEPPKCLMAEAERIFVPSDNIDVMERLKRYKEELKTLDIALQDSRITQAPSLRAARAAQDEILVGNFSAAYRILSDEPNVQTESWESLVSALKLSQQERPTDENASLLILARRQLIEYLRSLLEKGEHVPPEFLAENLYELSVDIFYVDYEIEEAIKYALEALDIYREITKHDPTQFEALAKSLVHLAELYEMLDNVEKAAEVMREAVDVYRELATQDKSRYGAALASALTGLAGYLHAEPLRELGVQLSREALSIRREISKPDIPSDQIDLARAMQHLGSLLIAYGSKPDGIIQCREAADVYQKIGQNYPGKMDGPVARGLRTLARELSKAGDIEGAISAGRRAADVWRRVNTETRSTSNQGTYADTVLNLATDLAKAGNRVEAISYMEEAINIYRKLAQLNPTRYEPGLGKALNVLSTALNKPEDAQRSLPISREATEIYRRLVQQKPLRYDSEFARALYNLAVDFGRVNDFSSAIQSATESVDVRRRIAEREPDIHDERLASNLSYLSSLYAAKNDFDGAIIAASDSAELYRKLFLRNQEKYRDSLINVISTQEKYLQVLGRHDEASKIAAEIKSLKNRQPPEAAQ